MDLHDLSKLKDLHHAYIVTGPAEKNREAVSQMLEKRGIRAGNPDMLSLSYGELLVDAVREMLLPFASLKPLGDKKYLVVSFSRANDAAQNALLKAVEESLGETIFFFCIESIGHMLPTLRSRCIAIRGGTKDREINEDAEAFLTEAYDKRLLRVEKMTAYISKTQDRGPVREFVRGLLSRAHEKRIHPHVLRDLLDADRYLRLQGASVKSILGHLAVTLPRS